MGALAQWKSWPREMGGRGAGAPSGPSSNLPGFLGIILQSVLLSLINQSFGLVATMMTLLCKIIELFISTKQIMIVLSWESAFHSLALAMQRRV